MSRLLLACAVSISLLATTAFAQEQNQSKRFITTQACDPVVKMSDVVMNKYGEQPLFQGEGIQFAAPTGQPYKSAMMFFVNQDSGTWSLVSLYEDGTACMVANGRTFEPYSGPIGKKTPG
jgi:hypothetical protein|tara:strand:- start:195 stop:554 length:360 start_codon:yes stop_codon:yes gene_type:complete